MKGITYRFATPYDPGADILYVNVVPRYSCPNGCRFCGRRAAIEGRDNIYEQKAGTRLWLPRTPLVEEVALELEVKRTPATSEIAFVGLGEPLLQFELVRGVIARVRADGFQGRIRVDSNGMVKCWRSGDPAQELKTAGLDEIRISVNATNGTEYDSISRPTYGDAFERLCEFVKDCIKSGIVTAVSFVVGYEDNEVKTANKKDCVGFAEKEFGLKPKNVIIREYVPHLAQKALRD